MNKIVLTALLAFAPSARAGGGEHGERIKFQGKPIVPTIAAKAGTRAGDVVWASGPSDKLMDDFAKVFFQGIVQTPDIGFQASAGDSKGWGPWVDAELEPAPNGRFWAQALLSGKAGERVRLRAVSLSGAAAQAQLFGIEAVGDEPEEAGGGARLHEDSLVTEEPAVTPPQTAAPEEPAVLPRSAWGASKASKPYEPMVPDRITVHHTEGFQAFSKEDAINELRVIQSFHKKGRGWIDIGYHFLIDGSGRIWEGRPVGVVGAHVRDKNDGNVGISLMGDFHPPKNNRPSIAQVQSLVTLLKWLTAKYAIAPDRIKGHRDQNDTSCPGDILYAMLPDIRRRVGAGTVAFTVPSPAQLQFALGPGGLPVQP